MWPFKKKTNVSIEAILKMGDLKINPSPRDMHKRHISRIATIQEVLKTIPHGSAEEASFRKELERRILEAKLAELKGGE